MKKMVFIAAAAALLVAGCSQGNGEAPATPDHARQEQQQPAGSPTSPAASPEPNREQLNGGSKNANDGADEGAVSAESPQDAAALVITALKDKDLTALKSYIHPEKGILFSPYAHVDQSEAQTFLAKDLPDWNDETVRTWGRYDGSGEPIELTFAGYYDRFVYDKDFINAETIGWNEIKGTGNTAPNIDETFPGSYKVDYYFSGFDEQYEGMDWESLILVLEEHDGGWFLSAIVHSQWTI